jgi:hypothetical protein
MNYRNLYTNDKNRRNDMKKCRTANDNVEEEGKKENGLL